jgi:hypothetical protein
MKYIILFFCITFLSCSSDDCGLHDGDNCHVSLEYYNQIADSMKKEDLIHLFGSPDSYSPPNVGYIDIERLVWYRSHDVLILPIGVYFTYLF